MSSSPAATAPDHIAVTDGGARLVATFSGGVTRALAAPRLRLACRCAPCSRARIDGMFPASFEAVTITAVEPIGHYAINIQFSDGHVRGIYPWGLLAELTEN